MTPKSMLAAVALAAAMVAGPARAQEQLVNPSFETPVAPAFGNNFYASIQGWTITATGAPAQPVNLIKPNAQYTGGPTAPPTGGGAQYFDVNATDGVISQTVTLPRGGLVDWGGWFSQRDFSQNVGGCTVRIKNSAGTVLNSSTVSFSMMDSVQTWKRASGTNLALAAGTYVFEVIIPNPINFDHATFRYYPDLKVTKSSTPVYDPVNFTTNPKTIPGGLVRYDLRVASTESAVIDANSQVLVDVTPARMALVVSGTRQPMFTPSTSGLALSYSGPASTTDAVDFSRDGGATWTYAPVPDATGVDAAVTHVRFRPQGSMPSNTDYTVNVTFAVR